MNIELSTNEYRVLLDMLHIADVVLTGHRREQDSRREAHLALIQKVYARAGVEGLGELIAYHERAEVYVPTEAFEKSTLAHRALDEFSDHLFWDELISRLSVRDAAAAAGGMDRLNAMSDSERQAAEGPIRQRYIEKFSKNGIADLAVIERFAESGGRAATSD